MPRKIIDFNLDLFQKNILPVCSLKQFDECTLNINLKSDGEVYNAIGCNAVIYISCKNDVYKQDTGITVNESTIKILLKKEMLQKYGKALAEIELINSEGVITSTTFILDVEGKIGEGSTIPGGIEGFVEKYERLIREFKSKVDTTVDSCNTRVDNKLGQLEKDYNTTKNEVIKKTDDKIVEIDKRFNQLTAQQQQDSEVIDARDGEISLPARLDRDLKYEDGKTVKDKIADIEGLKEMQDMKYETDKGYITCENTKNGVIDNIKIEGLSLNNLYENKQKNFQETVIYSPLESLNLGLLTEGKEYTVIILNNTTNYKSFRICDGNTTYDLVPKTIGNIAKFTYKPPTTELQKSVIAYFYPNQNKFVEGDQNKLHVLILEGDYTNKPIPTEAFTGIKSVGEEVTLTNLVTRYLHSAVQYVATSYVDNSKLKANDICTVLVDNPSEEDMRVYLNEDLFDKAPSFIVPSKSSIKYLATVKKDYVYSADAPQQSALLKNSITHTNTINYKACLIVGDYENSNLEYFEGTIKGYTIEIKSNNKNLFDIEEVKQNLSSRTQFGFVEYDGRENCVTLKDNINAIPWLTSPFKPNTRYRLTYSVFYQNKANEFKRGMYLRFIYTDGSFSTLNVQTTNQWINVDFISEAGKTVKYIDNSWGYPTSETKSYLDLDSVMLSEGTDIVPYVKHQQHKKVILLNEPLRGIEGRAKDLIAKIENKYYEKRVCAEVVLNGDENWTKYSDLGKCLCFYYKLPNQHGGSYTFINDKLKSIHSFDDTDHIHINDTGLHITIEKTKLETQDVEGFKKWLKANPVTVVYKLVKEELYECIPLSLNSYEDETIVQITSGAINPHLEFSITSHINNLVLSNRDRINYLEEKFTESLKKILAGDMQSLAYMLYPEDFKEEDIPTVIPEIVDM